MKKYLAQLDKAFENKVRLGVMSALMVNEHMDFTSLRDLLGVTDGNLASHIKSLEKSGYVNYQKDFLNRKPNTKYMITNEGRMAFKKHIKALENLLK